MDCCNSRRKKARNIVSDQRESEARTLARASFYKAIILIAVRVPGKVKKTAERDHWDQTTKELIAEKPRFLHTQVCEN